MHSSDSLNYMMFYMQKLLLEQLGIAIHETSLLELIQFWKYKLKALAPLMQSSVSAGLYTGVNTKKYIFNVNVELSLGSQVWLH